MDSRRFPRELRDEILRIAARYGARNVRVFGSFSRGEADEESDIDFLVELEAGRSLLDLGGLQYELERLLGCGVDVVTERGLRARIRDRPGLRKHQGATTRHARGNLGNRTLPGPGQSSL